MSSSNCCFLTCKQISQEAGQVVWYSHLLKNFPQFVVIHTVKGFGIVNIAEVDVFSETLLLFQWSSGCWHFDIWFLCLFQIQLEHLEVLGLCNVEPGLENFEHYIASMWDECNCAVVWTFFGIAFLWDGNENWSFPVLCCTFTALSFSIWNSSAGIPWPPLALFVMMLPKGHLTSHSRISGSRWVITPLWLSGSWRSVLYSSSVSYMAFIMLRYVPSGPSRWH